MRVYQDGNLVHTEERGVNAGAASLLPGGAGVQDGSTVGMFVVFGVPLESAVLATVLFRVVYYLIPFGLSLPLYYQLLRQAHQPPVA